MQPIRNFSTGKLGHVGIVAESCSKWERRTPLIPQDIIRLKRENPNIHFYVQPSGKRIFNDKAYRDAGATITSDLSPCNLILGIKQVSIPQLMPNRIYTMFSHTIKAQPANMPLLDEILKKKIQLVDYEKISNEQGQRLVAFGYFAGLAGAIDILHGVGLFLLNKGFSTPFLNIPQSYSYIGYLQALETISRVGKAIEYSELPPELCPFIIGVTGGGRCAEGANTVLEHLPIVKIKPEEVKELLKNKNDPAHRKNIYVVQYLPSDTMKHKTSNKEFDFNHYVNNPSEYESIFHSEHLPHISVLIHCIYWEQKFPRMITSKQMKELYESKESKLLAISDVTCDFEGSIEFLKFNTTIERPFYIWEPSTMTIRHDYEKCSEGILYQSIDQLPTEFALDSSKLFSNKLLPYINQLAFCDTKDSFQNHKVDNAIKRATITQNGKLTPSFEYINELRSKKLEKHQLN